MLSKANSRATVHRPAYLDYVGVKRFDESGEVRSERRFLGLFTHTVYSASPWEIPLLRRKLDAAVVGAPHAVLGEVPVAFVTLRAEGGARAVPDDLRATLMSLCQS